jgi:hypothetical protein
MRAKMEPTQMEPTMGLHAKDRLTPALKCKTWVQVSKNDQEYTSALITTVESFIVQTTDLRLYAAVGLLQKVFLDRAL